MTSVSGDNFLLLEQDINQFLMYIIIESQISYSTIRDFTNSPKRQQICLAREDKWKDNKFFYCMLKKLKSPIVCPRNITIYLCPSRWRGTCMLFW